MDDKVKGSNEKINNDFKISFPYNQTDGLDSKDTNYQDSVIINDVINKIVTNIGQRDSELKLLTKDDEQKCVFDKFIWSSNESVFSSGHNDMKNLISPSKRIMAIDECYKPIKKPKTEIDIKHMKSSENSALSLMYLHSKPVPDFPRLFDMIPSNTSGEEVLPAVIEMLSTNKMKTEKKQQNSLTIQECFDSNEEVHPAAIDNFNSNCIEIQQNYQNNTTKEKSSDKVSSEQSNLKEPVISLPAMNPATLVAYTPGGQRFEVDLTEDRPTYFKNEYARFQYDEATLINAQKMMYEIEIGNIVPKDLDPNIERQHNTEKIFVKKVLEDTLGKLNSESSDEEDTFQRRVSKLDNSDDDDDDTSNDVKDLQLLKVELSLLKFHQDISLMISDNPDECLVKFDEILQLQFKPIIFKKNPQLLELAKKLMNQSDFPDIQTAGRMFYNKIKNLFDVPEGVEFEEYFTSLVISLKQTSVPSTEAFTPRSFLSALLLSNEEIEDDLRTVRGEIAMLHDPNNEQLEDELPNGNQLHHDQVVPECDRETEDEAYSSYSESDDEIFGAPEE